MQVPPSFEEISKPRVEEHSSHYTKTLNPTQCWEWRQNFVKILRNNPTNISEVNFINGCTPEVVWALAGVISEAPIIAWSREIWETAQTGCESFVGQTITRDLIEHENQLWLPTCDLWNTPEQFGGAENLRTFLLKTGGRDIVSCIHVMVSGNRPALNMCAVYQFGLHTKERYDYALKNPHIILPYFHRCSVPLDQPLTDRDLDIRVAAMLSFLKLKVVSVQPHQFKPKWVQKYFVRHDRKPPDVRVVQLRKMATGSTVEHAPRNVEWSCQWLVGFPGGRWRKQWIPSKQTHEPRFIAPYVKGPADKPLKLPTGTIYAAVR